MDTMATAESRLEFQPLLEIAGPKLFRRNSFRVLGVSTRTTARDIKRLQNRRQMQDKLGVTAARNDIDNPLTLTPPASEEDTRAAIERLSRPVDRLLDEIFWFWPVSP